MPERDSIMEMIMAPKDSDTLFDAKKRLLIHAIVRHPDNFDVDIHNIRQDLTTLTAAAKDIDQIKYQACLNLNTMFESIPVNCLELDRALSYYGSAGSSSMSTSFLCADGITVTVHVRPHEYSEVVSESAYMIVRTIRRIVDVYDEDKIQPDQLLMFSHSAEEEAIEVAKEASKLTRRVADEYDAAKLMKTPQDMDTIMGELLKEMMDLLVVFGTAYRIYGTLREFSSRVDVDRFCRDYIYYKTARALDLIGRGVEINIKDYMYR